MKLPAHVSENLDREVLFEIFCALVPSVSELRNFYLCLSKSGRSVCSEANILETDYCRFKAYGTCSQSVMCKLYMYYWFVVFGFQRQVFDYNSRDMIPWVHCRTSRRKKSCD